MNARLALAVATLAIALLVALLAAAITSRRALRRRRERVAALRAAPLRPVLLALAAGEAEDEQEAVRRLAELADPQWEAIEASVVSMLTKLRGESRVQLVALLEQRGTVARALRDVRRHGVVRRAAAAELLGSVGAQDATPALVRLLEDRDEEVRHVAARALGRIGDAAAAPALLRALAGSRNVPASVVSLALVRLGPLAQPALIAGARDADPFVRAQAVEILGVCAAVGATTVVAERLTLDDATEVRIRAARALGRLGTPGGVKPLLDATAPDQPWPLRAVAARALGDVGATAALDRLVDLVGDPHHRVAHNAAHALLRLGPRGLAALQDLADAGAGRSCLITGEGEGGEASRSCLIPEGGGAAGHAREALDLARLRSGRTDGVGARA